MNSVDELNYLLGIGPPKPRLPVTLTKSGYSSVRALGKGSFGQAFLVFHKEKGKYYVVKHVNMINMNSRQRRDAHNEIAVLQQLNHPNIVRYVECYEEHPHLYIVMEYADGGDLYTHLEKINRLKNPTLLRRPDQSGGGGLLTEPQVISLFVQTTMAVKYMHDRRLLHRDIKSQNVFLTHNHVVKLGDFGIATVLQNTVAMASTMCGTPCYFSPELCQGKAYNNKSDIWALGVLLYELCAGRLPFESTTMKALMREIVSREPRRIPGAYTDDLWQLIRWMLKKDPQSRPDAGQVLLTPVLMRHVPDIMAQLKSATMDDIYPRHVQPPSVRAESVGEEDSTDYSGGECAVADTAPYRQLLAHQQDGMRDGKLVMPPGAGNNPFAGAIAPSTAGGGYVSSARPPPSVAPEAEAPPEKIITSQQATKTNSPSAEHGSAPRKSSGESAQSRPSPRAPSPPGLFSSPRKSPAGAPGLSPGAAAAKAMAEKAQRQVDSSRVHSSRKVPSPAPAASPEVTHNKSKSSSAVRGPEAEDSELGAVLLEMTLHLTDFEKSVKAHAAADDINDEDAPKASPQGTPPNKIIKGGPATLPNDKSPPPSSRSPHVSPDTKRNRQDASAPTSAKVDTTPKTDFSDPTGAKLDVEGLQENHRSAVSPPHSSPERGSTDGRSDMQRSINTKFNASRSGGASSSQRLGVKPSDPEAGNTSSRSNSHRQQSSKTSTSGAAASEAKEVDKTACPEPCSVGEDVTVGADRDGEDVPFSGSCLCQQAQLRGWLSTIYGSFLCACEACCRVSGASRSTGVEWLHLPNVEHMKEVVCCRSGDDSAAGKGATAARRLTDPEAAKVWLNKAGIRQYAFNLMVSDDDEDEEVSTTPGRRRPASFDVFFCTQCGCTLGMKHDGVDGLILVKSTLDSESAATLLKFAYPAE